MYDWNRNGAATANVVKVKDATFYMLSCHIDVFTNGIFLCFLVSLLISGHFSGFLV